MANHHLCDVCDCKKTVSADSDVGKTVDEFYRRFGDETGKVEIDTYRKNQTAINDYITSHIRDVIPEEAKTSVRAENDYLRFVSDGKRDAFKRKNGSENKSNYSIKDLEDIGIEIKLIHIDEDDLLPVNEALLKDEDMIAIRLDIIPGKFYRNYRTNMQTLKDVVYGLTNPDKGPKIIYH